MDVEYICVDPVLGDVSFETEAQARAFATKVEGSVAVILWENGEPIERREI